MRQTAMRAFIASDYEPLTIQVREILLREGWDCPASHVLALDLAAEKLAHARPDLILAILRPNPERSLLFLRQLRNGITGRLLALGPAESKLILRALREGADLYLDEADIEGELLGAFTRFPVAAGSQAEPGRLIGLLAPSGGSGSSTVAVNVGIVLAKEHKSCALLDLKTEGGDLAALLDLKPTHTLADLCQNAARMDRVMLEGSLVHHQSGIHLLASPQHLADIAAVHPDGVRQALALARAAFPYVVADLGYSFRDEQVQVLRQADVVLVVLRLDIPSLVNTRRTLDHLERLGVAKDRIHLVANRYGQPKELPAGKAEKALGTKIFHYLPDDPKTINQATNSGIPAVLDAPSARISRSFVQLATSVNGHHEEQ
jgi:pilus assembly protein CpaE